MVKRTSNISFFRMSVRVHVLFTVHKDVEKFQSLVAEVVKTSKVVTKTSIVDAQFFVLNLSERGAD